MKQLRLTTSNPGFFGTTSAPHIIPEELGETIPMNEQKCKNAYIHGEAETLAGFDIPIILDGDLNQLNQPVEEQDILLMLPDGNYQCKCTIEEDLIRPAYYITLKEDWKSLKNK